MSKLQLQPITPVGITAVHNIFGDALTPAPVYPLQNMKRQFKLRELRTELAANLLGITKRELQELEQGAFTCDWDEAERILRSHFK